MVPKTVNRRQADGHCQVAQAISVAEEQRVTDNIECVGATFQPINNGRDILGSLDAAFHEFKAKRVNGQFDITQLPQSIRRPDVSHNS